MCADIKQSSSLARVTAEFKGMYRVKASDGEYYAKVRGKRMFEASSREDFPAVGDYVSVIKLDEDRVVITDILPRETVIKRTYRNRVQIIATNVDVAFVVESVDRDYNLNRFERYFAIAEGGGVKPAIVLNKVDLLSAQEVGEKMSQMKNRFQGVDIIFTSTINNAGLDTLKEYISRDKTYCFLGSSGVGKSSLINKLLGENGIKTDNISWYSGRGKHVTTSRQMYFLENGAVLIDNPGMREIGMADAGQGVDTFFDEISVLSEGCRFGDCTHTHELGCEVIKAIQSGILDKDKYDNYINLKKEAEYYEMDDIEKREKGRKFGRFLKKAKKEVSDFKNKK